MNREWYSVDDLAGECGVNHEQVMEWVKAGEIRPAIRNSDLRDMSGGGLAYWWVNSDGATQRVICPTARFSAVVEWLYLKVLNVRDPVSPLIGSGVMLKLGPEDGPIATTIPQCFTGEAVGGVIEGEAPTGGTPMLVRDVPLGDLGLALNKALKFPVEEVARVKRLDREPKSRDIEVRRQDAIIKAIRDMGVDPLNLPRRTSDGYVKQSLLEYFTQQEIDGINTTEDSFEKAWKRLRADGRIKN